MTTLQASTAVHRAARMITGLNLLMVLVAYALSLVLDGRLILEILPLNALLCTVLAALILARHPRHTVGWLFLAVGFLAAFGTVGLALNEELSRNGSELTRGLSTWIGELLWIPTFIIPLTLVLLFFPDGRLPGRRWWPVAAASVAGMATMMVYFAVSPWPAELEAQAGTGNPFVVSGRERLLELISDTALVLVAVGAVGSLAAVVARFRRAQGAERTQMKWLVYVAVVTIGSLVLVSLLFGNENQFTFLVFVSLPSLLAATMTMAILRYRLFDIDIIIRRTLQYTLLTGILVVIYFGLVITFQAFVTAAGSQRSEIFIVLSTLIIAALFNPLRRRIQDVIDRRFYRSNYDAEQALARFSAAARDEVDLEALTAALLATVNETMRPAHLSLWLKERAVPADE
jgi:hypothetical protein